MEACYLWRGAECVTPKYVTLACGLFWANANGDPADSKQNKTCTPSSKRIYNCWAHALQLEKPTHCKKKSLHHNKDPAHSKKKKKKNWNLDGGPSPERWLLPKKIFIRKIKRSKDKHLITKHLLFWFSHESPFSTLKPQAPTPSLSTVWHIILNHPACSWVSNLFGIQYIQN